MSYRAVLSVGTRDSIEQPRYKISPGEEGWTVMDMLSGLPAASNGRDFIKLRKADAREISDELNNCEKEGAPSPLL